MFSDYAINTVLKNSKQNRTNNLYQYLIIYFLSLLLALVHETHYESVNTTIQLRHDVFLLSFFIFLFISFHYFVINEIRKRYSLITVNLIIKNLMENRWDWSIWANNKYVGKPVFLHKNTLRHPVTIFLYGLLFEHEGRKEGKKLTEMIKEKYPMFARIEVAPRLSEDDADYLIQLLLEEKEFNTLKRLY